LYLAIHETLVAALGKLGIEASINSRPSELTPAEEPFLCFERRAKGDVLYGTAKIAGSAERRRRGAILQHGSILLARSPAAPELAGLGELCGRPVERAPLIAAWLEELERGLGWRFLHSSLTKDEVRLAEQLAAQRFELTSWNSRR
jgi:lipoate-protein ligase A